MPKNNKTGIDEDYFTVICRTDHRYELRSKNTGHCWLIEKNSGGSVTTLHRHSEIPLEYHFQCNAASIESAVKKIKKHDKWVIKNSKQARNNRKKVKTKRIKNDV